MNYYVIFAVLSILALANANVPKNKKKDEGVKITVKTFKDIARSARRRFNSTLLVDIAKMGEMTKEKCPTLEEKMELTLEEVQKCIEKVELGPNTLCTLIKTNYIKCGRPLRDLIASCLPEESKDLPSMAEKVLSSVIEVTCGSTVEEMVEFMNPCIMEKDPGSFPACKEVGKVVNEYRDKLPSKALVCSTLPKLRNCVKAIQDASCKGKIARDVIVKFHDAIDNSIKGECDALNNV